MVCLISQSESLLSSQLQFCELLAVSLHSIAPLLVQLQCYALKVVKQVARKSAKFNSALKSVTVYNPFQI